MTRSHRLIHRLALPPSSITQQQLGLFNSRQFVLTAPYFQNRMMLLLPQRSLSSLCNDSRDENGYRCKNGNNGRAYSTINSGMPSLVNFGRCFSAKPNYSSLNDKQRNHVPFNNERNLFSNVFNFSTTSSSSPSPIKDSNEPTADKVNKNNKPNNSSPPSIIPGVALSALTATTGFQLSALLSSVLSVPLSGIPTSILLGILINNAVLQSPTVNNSATLPSQSHEHPTSISNYYRNPTLYKPGLTYSTKTILQAGIVAVAAKLSFFELVTTGSQGLPVVMASVGMGMVYIPLAGKMAGLSKELTALLTAGTSICGVTAITALAPAVSATNRDIAIAVANTVAFGTIGMLTYPYLFHTLCISPEQVGICLGVSIHDTSQVLGSAMSYKDLYGDELALKVAAVTKLTRNLGLMVAIPGLTYWHAKETINTNNNSGGAIKTGSDGPGTNIKETMSGLVSFQKFVPPFLVAFLGMSTLRTIGDYSFAAEAVSVFTNSSVNESNAMSSSYMIFQHTMDFLGNDVSKYALGTAMAGVGLSTSIDSLKGVGWRPFAVGGSGALVVGGTGFIVSSLIM